MPKPYDGNWAYTARSLFAAPSLAAHIAVIAAMWSHVELGLGHLFSRMLSVDANIGVAMYQALISEAARDAALLAGAKEKLSEELFKDFETLLRQLKSPRRKRNEVVHGLWGTTPTDDPDVLVLIDNKSLVRLWAAQ